MRRRTVIKALSAGVLGSATGYALSRGLDHDANGVAMGVRTGCLCAQSDSDLRVVSHRTDQRLVYQGTHLLTHGAFRELAEHYQRDTGYSFEVFGGGCDDGIAAVQKQRAHLGGLCCPVEDTRARAYDRLLVARDIKVVVTHPAVGVENLAFDELQALARGHIVRWSALGGPDRPVAWLYRDHCPDYREPVRDILLDNRPEWSPRGIGIDTDERLAQTIAQFHMGVGVVSWVFAAPYVEQGALNVVSVDGVSPTADAVTQGDYPLHGPLYVIMDRWFEPLMRPFFEYLFSESGQAIVSRRLVAVSAHDAGYTSMLKV
ncbi:MAG: substrate-binding domain-containing protein [Thioalkalivibrionaceae bacterium]